MTGSWLAEYDRTPWDYQLHDCYGYQTNGFHDIPTCANCGQFVRDTGWHLDPETAEYECSNRN